MTTRTLRPLVVLGAAMLLGARCHNNQPKPISAAVKSEVVTGNGFSLTLVYQTDDPLIIAHVQETQELRDPQNALIRTWTLDYWEWFTLGMLNGQPGGMPAAEWQNIQQFNGKQVVLSDAIQTGPAIAANVNAAGFKVVIDRTHTLYTGGALANQGAGTGLDRGSFGFLNADANGTGPSLVATQGAQTLDMTPAWRQNKTIAGSIQNVGTQQIVLRFHHEGAWQKPAGQNTYSVDWSFSKTIGTAAAVTSQGSSSGLRPASHP